MSSGVSWSPPELMRFWSHSDDFPTFGAFLTWQNGSNLGVLGILWRTHGRDGTKRESGGIFSTLCIKFVTGFRAVYGDCAITDALGFFYNETIWIFMMNLSVWFWYFFFSDGFVQLPSVSASGPPGGTHPGFPGQTLLSSDGHHEQAVLPM